MQAKYNQQQIRKTYSRVYIILIRFSLKNLRGNILTLLIRYITPRYKYTEKTKYVLRSKLFDTYHHIKQLSFISSRRHRLIQKEGNMSTIKSMLGIINTSSHISMRDPFNTINTAQSV